MKEVEITFKAKVDDHYVETLKNIVDHHLDYLLDLDGNPEIFEVFGAWMREVTIQNELMQGIRNDTYNGYNACEFNYRQLRVARAFEDFKFRAEIPKEIKEMLIQPKKNSAEVMERIFFTLAVDDCRYGNMEEHKRYLDKIAKNLDLEELCMKYLDSYSNNIVGGNGEDPAYIYQSPLDVHFSEDFSICLNTRVKINTNDKTMTSVVDDYVIDVQTFDSIVDMAKMLDKDIFKEYVESVFINPEQNLRKYALIRFWDGWLDEDDLEHIGVYLNSDEKTPPEDKESYFISGQSQKKEIGGVAR